MASRPLTPAFSAFDLTTSWQTIYLMPSDVLRAGIDATVFNNYSGAVANFSVRIVQEGVATPLNDIITNESIRPSRSSLASPMIGQSILAGGLLQAKASADNSISATGTVTEIIT